jgi:hypothetical protein
MGVYAFGLLVLLGLIWLAIRLAKSNGYKDAIIEKDNVEKEIIEENRKSTWANLDTINKLDDAAVKQLLKSKWTRK